MTAPWPGPETSRWLGRVAEVFADQRGIVQVMVFNDEFAAARGVIGFDEGTNLEQIQNDLLVGGNRLSFG